MQDEQAPVSAGRSRVTQLHGSWKVGPLGRAVVERGGAVRTIDPGGRGIFSITPDGEPVSLAPAPETRTRGRGTMRMLLVIGALLLAWSLLGLVRQRTQAAQPVAGGHPAPAAIEAGSETEPTFDVRDEAVTAPTGSDGLERAHRRDGRPRTPDRRERPNAPRPSMPAWRAPVAVHQAQHVVSSSRSGTPAPRRPPAEAAIELVPVH